MPRLPSILLLSAALLLVAAGSASAALRLDSDTSGESLVVAAHGAAQVTFTSRGSTKTVVVSGSSLRFAGGLSQSPDAQRVPPTIPFALVQYRLANGEQLALQRFQRTGQFGALGPFELYLARWRGDPTLLTLTVSGGRLCGTVTYHGTPVFGGAHTVDGNPLDDLGRNVYFDALRPAGWYRMLGVLARPQGFALALRADLDGSRYRARVVGPNVSGDLAPVASAQTPASANGTCPFSAGAYAGA